MVSFSGWASEVWCRRGSLREMILKKIAGSVMDTETIIEFDDASGSLLRLFLVVSGEGETNSTTDTDAKLRRRLEWDNLTYYSNRCGLEKLR
jgi:hypothetical protein